MTGNTSQMTLTKQSIGANLKIGGSIRQAVDMFDEIKDLEDSVKFETVSSSLCILSLVNWCLIKANKDQSDLLAQLVAAGIFTKTAESLYQKFCTNEKIVVNSFNPSRLNFVDWSQ